MGKTLEIKNLHAGIKNNEILKGVTLSVGAGETHVIMGPNGAGKSTLGCCIMGSPSYEVMGGSITFEDEDITEEETEKRAKAGIFLTFQNPIEIPGITLADFIKSAVDAKNGSKCRYMTFRKELDSNMDKLSMDRAYADRDLNVGFSGGEKKKAEILQMLMLSPKLAILDETDSGLDIDAVKVVSDGVKAFHENNDGALIIITHSTRILEALKVDAVHILVDGEIVKSGDESLINEINSEGFEKYL
ncbi:Fe-S cluster assembly ATP-binding protein [Eubacterium uniforme]|uniref:Fe-S cluster assembly ATP-binding protein n=1 Tax=Eubacterium uniforme TaxID=39495 RepID=A0A1T4VCT0_9FIRM|nr:Fe-S cluster assembly ATPase SufC [Eubacterium uniforme]SKA62713.1 Fe-S cluster assembly ATP-binding protein [Eubacterium uniforme]